MLFRSRWPVNCSLVNDRMKAKEKAFDVRKTAYEKTANLVADLVEDGTLKTARRGDNLELATCRFLACWPDAPPAAYHMANLTGLDVAIPSTLAKGKVKDYCLWGSEELPPTRASTLLREHLTSSLRYPD